MQYCVVNGDQNMVICYCDDENGYVASYKWGSFDDCYKWVFSYDEALTLIRRIQKYAVIQRFHDTCEEWSVKMYIMDARETRYNEYSDEGSPEYGNQEIRIGRFGL